MPRPRSAEYCASRFANLTRPGAATTGVVAALGLGLTLLATVTLLDRTISAQVKDSLPDTAPTFFFVDIQPDEAGRFDAVDPRLQIRQDYQAHADDPWTDRCASRAWPQRTRNRRRRRWALNGDRGITYAATPPEGTVITRRPMVAGQLFRPDAHLLRRRSRQRHGPEARRHADAERAGPRDRRPDRQSSATSISRPATRTSSLILSPGIIDHAPHCFLATVRVAPDDEEPLYRAVTDKFPSISTVRVKDAIAQVNGLLQQLSTACARPVC